MADADTDDDSDADAIADRWPDYFAFQEPYDNQADAIESAWLS